MKIIRSLRKVLPILALLAFFTSGCVRHHVRHHHAGAQVVVIKKGHVHSDRCGHYRRGNKWYFVRGHVHGSRCGHVFVSGVWIVR